MLCLDDSVDGPRLPFLGAQVASMLWALGFWIWEGATGDFTMAPTTSARRHEAPTSRTCLLRRLLLLRGEGSHFATGQRLHHSTVSRPYRASRIV
ncbi:hypothetical protein FJTKL_13541 [Diaporthe vaccinii]|uniref:Secreted protein n=1 Tax=Diaporthe vaccinii TaxID=105482 RepID=A0ABR4EAC2_9PEZI